MGVVARVMGHRGGVSPQAVAGEVIAAPVKPPSQTTRWEGAESGSVVR